MNVKMKIFAIVLAAAVVVCAALLLAWRPWGVDGGTGGDARAVTQEKAGATSADAPQQVSESPAKNVADAALTEEGFAALFPENIEVVSPGPFRDKFASDEEWEHYWEHFHESDAGLKYDFPIVKDEQGRQYVPGEITLTVDETIADQDIRSAVESRGLHVSHIVRADGVSTVVTVHSDDIAANPDEMSESFASVEGFVAEGPNWVGNVLDDATSPVSHSEYQDT